MKHSGIISQIDELKFPLTGECPSNAFPSNDPRLLRKQVVRAVMVVSCWSSDDQINEVSEAEGNYEGPDNLPIFDPETGEKIRYHMAAHLHHAEAFRDGKFTGSQKINFHAYLDPTVIKGDGHSYAVVEVLVEEVEKHWHIFDAVLTRIDSHFKAKEEERKSSLEVLVKVKEGIKKLLERLPYSLNDKKQVEQLDEYMEPLRAKSQGEFTEETAEAFLKELQESLSIVKFPSYIYPISYYPLTVEYFMEHLRKGELYTMEFFAGDVQKDGFERCIVQRNKIRNSAATIGVRKCNPSEMDVILEKLFEDGVVKRREFEALKVSLGSSAESVLPAAGTRIGNIFGS